MGDERKEQESKEARARCTKESEKRQEEVDEKLEGDEGRMKVNQTNPSEGDGRLGREARVEHGLVSTIQLVAALV